jgi:type I restriction enzyme S subunit
MKSPWPTKKLGEICEENIKSPFKVEDATNSGEYPFFTSGENVLTHDEYLVDGENIFLATGGYANVKYYNGKASYSTDTWSLKVKNALTKFVFYQILARLKYIDEVLFRGSGLRHLQKKEFLNLEIPLPPLPIQQKIVKILDTIQSAVEIQEKIIEKTKELKKSLMNLLFHYGLAGLRVKELASSRVSELTSSEIETLSLKLKQTEIGEIPEDWEVVRLGEIAEVVRGGSPRPKGDPRYFSKKPTGIHWITIADITKYKIGQYVVNTDEYVTKEAIKNSRYLEKGTLVLTNSGTVGIPAILGINGCIHDGLLALLNLRRTDLMYLYYYFDFTKQIFQQIAPKGTQANLNTIIVGNFKIPLPPLSEQQEIAEILQTVDQKIEIERRKKELYEELFKTVLNKIMNQEIDINLLNY